MAAPYLLVTVLSAPPKSLIFLEVTEHLPLGHLKYV